jgi:hypothetical protein
MEDNFSPQQSLQVIQSMIEKTRNNISENRFYFLLWGWVTFTCILAQFVLKVLVHYRHHYLVWFATIITAFISFMYSRKREKGTRTYIGDSMAHLWTGIGISFFILSIIISQLPETWYHAYPFFILFYGLGTFISGRLLQFRPLILGGIINWVLAILAAFAQFDYQLLFAAAAILTSYIIPGHLIKSEKSSYARTR